MEHWDESHWRCRQPPLPSPGLSEPSGAVSRVCLTMKIHRGWDSKATFFSPTLFLLHLNWLASLVFLWVVSSNFCSPKPKKSCIWALTCAELCKVGFPPFCERALHSSHQSQPLAAKKTGLALISDLIFSLSFFLLIVYSCPPFFSQPCSTNCMETLIFLCLFCINQYKFLCIITIAVDGINILIIDTEQGSFCLSRLFLLSPH